MPPDSAAFDVAECAECEPSLPIPFKSARERDEWADAHANETGHAVWRFTGSHR